MAPALLGRESPLRRRRSSATTNEESPSLCAGGGFNQGRFFRRHRYQILVVLILILAATLRFYNYPHRWGLAFDQARDALIGREAVGQNKIPLLGPFASGANVVGGPQWFWLIALFTWLYPWSVLSPWVGLTISYVLFVFLMIKIGEELGEKKLGLFMGVVAAFSPAQISQGVNLTNQGPIAVMAAFSIWAMLKYLKTKRAIFAFLLGTGIAMSFNIHLQGINLFFLIPIVAILGWRHSLKATLLFFFAFGLQFIPFFIFEFRKDFYNTRGLLNYFFYGQYETGISTRWLTYVFSFWPNLWTKIVGGNKWLSYFQGVSLSVLITLEILRKKISKEHLALVLSFILIFINLRYYRGPRFESYFVFIHPFVLFFAAWFIWKMFVWRKAMGVLLLFLVILGSARLNLEHYRQEKNTMYPLVKSWKNELTEKFPGKKFAVYDFQLLSREKTASLALILAVEGLIGDEGIKIGVACSSQVASEEVFFTDGNCFLSDISQIKKDGDDWAFLNPSEIWKETEEWYLKK